MLRDLRHAARMLVHAKGWTLVVVLSLALGIGANTAIFSAVNGLFLRTLPVRDPDTLVRFRYVGKNDMVTSSSDYGSSRKNAGRDVRTTFSYPMYQQFVAENRTLEGLVACAPYGRVSVVVDGQADIANAFISSGNYYRMLGLAASPGRTILPDDDKPGAPPAAVIGAKYWRSRFAGSPHAIGKTVLVNNVPVTIVGVIVPELTAIQAAVQDGPDIALPLSLDTRLNVFATAFPGEPSVPRLEQPTYWWLQVMGRVKPGITAEQVHANLGGVFQYTARAGLDSYLAGLTAEARSNSNNRNRTDVPQLLVDSGSRGIYDVREADVSSVTILSGVVVLVLLIVCANVANLLLSRATARQKEFSVRLSLGATRGRLVRQLLTESLLLAAISGGLGVVLGQWGQQLLPGNAGQATPLDWRVLLFACAVASVTGVLFGIAPALRATGMNVSATLKETSRSVAGSRSLLGKGLLVVQVAISIVLLVAAGLFLRTLQNLRHAEVGFNTQNLVIFRIQPALNGYDDKRVAALFDQVLERMRSVPGVKSAALANVALLSGSTNSTSIFVAGRAYAIGERNSINRLVVSPGFFDTMGMSLKRGRAISDRDTQASPKVAVINEAAVRTYFPNEDPVGMHIGSSVETSGQVEIVGVLSDAKYASVREEPPPTMYVPHRQGRFTTAVYQIRTVADPLATVGAIREAVRQLDPNLPMMDVSTQIEQVEKRLAQERIFAQAYALFGLLAVLIASIGLFGLMSYSVARRTNEIGIRMALGARAEDVLRLVMGESMILVAIGVAVGIATALASGPVVASLLYRLQPTDVASLGVATVLMLVVSGIAAYLPARRAARVDPMVALHYD